MKISEKINLTLDFSRLGLLLVALVGACAPSQTSRLETEAALTATPKSETIPPTPLPDRPLYNPGELVDYRAQTGDTLPALAAHFNTTQEEILNANPIIPSGASTLPPGLPMEIPIYHRNFWGTPFQIIPDSQFVNGPLAAEFNTAKFIAENPGWLANYQEYAADANRSAAEIIDLVARDYSVSPRVLLAISEYLAGGLSRPELPADQTAYPLGHRSYRYRGYYLQLVWAANLLNNGYYGWRGGELVEFELADGTIERPDPWQNAASVAIQYLFKELVTTEQYRHAISPSGIDQTYKSLFGDSWEADEPHIPGSLAQPGMLLPFPAGETWDYTGGPHSAWGRGAPFAALDFAPPSDNANCAISLQWSTAVADGIVIRSEPGQLALDLDMDGDERTGWVIFYLHISGQDITPAGTIVKAGDQLGHASCEAGSATGTHIHLARKFNGEWILADSPVPFVMENWVPHTGEGPYAGTLTRFEHTVIACVCADQDTTVLATGNTGGIPDQPTNQSSSSDE